MQREFKLSQDSLSSKGYYTPDNGFASPVDDLVSKFGKVLITKIDGPISGTFEFTCESSKTGKVYKITEGCFNDL